MPETAPIPAEAAPSRFALSIVVPVYNGASSIGELVGALEELQIPGGHEIVLVNDGSPDDSLAVCRGLVERARVPMLLVDLSRNYGEHNAVMAGLRHTSGAHVTTMDDDLQNPPEEVERLLAFAQQSGHEVIYTYYDEKRHAAWRNLGSRFTNWVAGFVIDKPKGFYLSSFRCMSAFIVREVARYEGPFPYVDGLILQVTQDIDRLLVRHLPRAGEPEGSAGGGLLCQPRDRGHPRGRRADCAQIRRAQLAHRHGPIHPPDDHDRRCDLCLRGVLLHRRVKEDPDIGGVPLGRGELRRRRNRRPSPVERALRLA